ncbi:MAG: hypothetical protein ACLR23_00160 [Clostridia bacterium]
MEWAANTLAQDVLKFSTTDEFFAKAPIDVVIIATPHYDHPVLAIEAFSTVSTSSPGKACRCLHGKGSGDERGR